MLNDMGILADSVRYYHDADAFTATNLYHVPHAGSYHCDETYGMQRNYLDICQMLVVDEGELSVTYRGETRTAGPGSLILLDCREPHSYHALTPIRMRWFHFAGSVGLGNGIYRNRCAWFHLDGFLDIYVHSAG